MKQLAILGLAVLVFAAMGCEKKKAESPVFVPPSAVSTSTDPGYAANQEEISKAAERALAAARVTPAPSPTPTPSATIEPTPTPESTPTPSATTEPVTAPAPTPPAPALETPPTL